MRDPHPESIGASLEVSSQNTQRRGAEGSERRITICGSYHRAAPPGNAAFVRMRNSGGPGTPHLYECVVPRCLELRSRVNGQIGDVQRQHDVHGAAGQRRQVVERLRRGTVRG